MSARPLPRVDAAGLDHAQFLERYVAPGVPVILTGLGRDWPARHSWSLRSFVGRVRPEEVVVKMFKPDAVVMGRTTLGRILSETLAPSEDRGYRLYLTNWHFYRTHPELCEDYRVPSFFEVDHSGAFTGDRLQWIYFGEAGTQTPAHVDVLRSSAWLYLFEGRKEWRFFTGPAGASADESATLYVGTQAPGELVWSPPGVVHAVRNIRATLALTHNYVDLTNAATVLASPGLGESSLGAWAREPERLRPWLAALVADTRARHFGVRETIARIAGAQLAAEPGAPRAALEAALAELLA